jgi:hypothetical protein
MAILRTLSLLLLPIAVVWLCAYFPTVRYSKLGSHQSIDQYGYVESSSGIRHNAQGFYWHLQSPSQVEAGIRFAAIVIASASSLYAYRTHQRRQVYKDGDLMKIRDAPIKGEVLMPVRRLPSPRRDVVGAESPPPRRLSESANSKRSGS